MIVLLYIYFILIVIICVGGWSKRVPYYPIEISRIAASEMFAAEFFKWSFALIPIIIYIFPLPAESYSNFLWLAYVALQIITFWNDVEYWEFHMFGVTLLGISATAYSIVRITHERTILIAAAGLLWTIRLCLKCACVFFIEDRSDIFNASKEIMHKGECRYPQTTLYIFRIAGVLQWIVFFIMGLLLIY